MTQETGMTISREINNENWVLIFMLRTPSLSKPAESQMTNLYPMPNMVVINFGFDGSSSIFLRRRCT